ncbi:MAG: transposase [Bacteroidetes bacterium]|jgi:putative transposase|nr:transposase [Bacteroidota bacterium]
MPYIPHLHHRRSIRLKGYDYSQEGLYFITICQQDRECLFGEIVDGEMLLNDAGKMVDDVWLKIPERFPHVLLHEYIIMPNHFHAILEILGSAPAVRATLVVAPDKAAALGDILGAFKSISTVEYIQGVKKCGWPTFNGKLWQRDFFDHIIRNERSFHRISRYILNNPKNWKGDKFY